MSDSSRALPEKIESHLRECGCEYPNELRAAIAEAIEEARESGRKELARELEVMRSLR